MQLIWFDKTISLAIALSGSNLDLGMFDSPRRIDSESDHENRFCKNRLKKPYKTWIFLVFLSSNNFYTVFWKLYIFILFIFWKNLTKYSKTVLKLLSTFKNCNNFTLVIIFKNIFIRFFFKSYKIPKNRINIFTNFQKL